MTARYEAIEVGYQPITGMAFITSTSSTRTPTERSSWRKGIRKAGRTPFVADCIGSRQWKDPAGEETRQGGAVRRRRSVDTSVMPSAALPGFGTGRERALVGLRRNLERVTRKWLLEPLMFQGRFTSEPARHCSVTRPKPLSGMPGAIR